MKRAAHTLSVLLHPLFMPVYTLWLALTFDPQIRFFLRPDHQLVLLGLVAVMTVAFPLTSTVLLLRAGLVGSLTMPGRQERIVPYMLTLFYYGLTWYLLGRSSLHHPLLGVFTGIFLALLLTTVITLRWKISTHLVGMGGTTGALAALAGLHQLALLPLIAVLIVITGLLGTARLLSGTHSPAQVYAGAVLGFACTYGCTSFLSFS